MFSENLPAAGTGRCCVIQLLVMNDSELFCCVQLMKLLLRMMQFLFFPSSWSSGGRSLKKWCGAAASCSQLRGGVEAYLSLTAGAAGGSEAENGAGIATARANHWPTRVIGSWPSIRPPPFVHLYQLLLVAGPLTLHFVNIL